MTSPYLSFFLALDNLPRLDASVLADRLGRDYQQFLQRRWVVPAGHLTHVMVPFLDSEQEVEVGAGVGLHHMAAIEAAIAGLAELGRHP